jgi:hypothetical protein
LGREQAGGQGLAQSLLQPFRELALQLIRRNRAQLKRERLQPVEGAGRAELIQHPRQHLREGLVMEAAEAFLELARFGWIRHEHL